MIHSNINKFKFEIEKIHSDFFYEMGVDVLIARLDKINNIVSGNKIFKLNNFIEDAINKKKKTIVTKGGYYSNHLVATAFYTKQNNLNSVGIIRGEKPKLLSLTLKECIEHGMNLQFVSREDYDNHFFLNSFLQNVLANHPLSSPIRFKSIK